MDILESTKQTCRLIASEPANSRSRKVAEIALKLRLGQSKDIESLLQASDKGEIWPIICDAVAISHGEGHVFTQHGVTKSLSALPNDRRRTILESIQNLLDLLESRIGLKAFFTSGTLLGMIRDGDLIGHDDDIDTCYVSRASNFLNLGFEWHAIRQAINRIPGCRAESPFAGIMHVYIPAGAAETRFDLFTSICNDGNFIQYPLNTTLLKEEDVLPLQTTQFYGLSVKVPRHPERHLTANYGDGWATPDPTYRFDWDRAERQYKDLLRALREAPLPDSWLGEQLPPTDIAAIDLGADANKVLVITDDALDEELKAKLSSHRSVGYVPFATALLELRSRLEKLSTEPLYVISCVSLDRQAEIATWFLSYVKTARVNAAALGRVKNAIFYRLEKLADE